ncbi:MAG TPA: ribonuclease P protein component [Opitutaceae bacterium]|nr:ribonuclease P protein component [Opitutaceae bacterium]
MRFRPEQHLRRPGDFRTVREQGRRLDCGAFTLWWLARGDAAPARLGVVASYAQVGNAVERARAKRRLRELFRRHQTLVPAGCDLMLVARAAVNRWEFPALAEKFTAACARLPASTHA